jgi:hypothetical protein
MPVRRQQLDCEGPTGQAGLVREPHGHDEELNTMHVCGLTRLLVPASLVGLAVATLTGSDPYGWIAAALTVAVLTALPTVRRTGGAGAIAPPADAGDATDANGERPDLRC